MRYRGYYFDAETGFYYLQSRYYDPTLGRFINADSYASTGQGFLGCNMFAYCNNDPIIICDTNGHKPYSVDLYEQLLIVPDDYIVYPYHYSDSDMPDYDGKKFYKKKNKEGRVYIYTGKGDPATPKYFRPGKDVLFADKRKQENPDIQLIVGETISNEYQKYAIAETLLQFNADYPSSEEWNRSAAKIVYEWDMHVLAVSLGFDVLPIDFDQNDENSGFFDYVKKGLDR